jgi:hypothetical protein
MLHAANTIGFVHILVEIWLASGLLLSWLFPRILRYYCATLTLTLFSRLVYGACPLTVWQESLKHHPDVEPLLSSTFTIEAPATWMGLDLGSTETQILMIIAFAISLALLRFPRSSSKRLTQ